MTSSETRSERNFKDFDNMLKGIHCTENYVSYTAILIVDKVKLERNPYRSLDVDAWYNEVFYNRRNIFQRESKSNFRFEYDSDVSDIED